MNGMHKDCSVITVHLTDKRLQELSDLSQLELTVWVVKNLTSLVKKEKIVSISLIKDPKSPTLNILYRI